ETKTKTEMKNEQKKQREKLRLQQKKKKEIEKIEKTINDYEKRLNILEEEMCKEEVYSDPDKSLKNLQETTSIKENLDNLYEKWEILLID
ncbi:MAG: thiamine ABC transporter substrate-binding protein, partial [Senegalia sp. (in: firmicutes)]